MEVIGQYFRPEFLARLSEIVPFSPIREDILLKIFDIHFNSVRKLLDKQGIGCLLYTSATAADRLYPVTVDGRVKPVCRGGGKVHAILGEKGSGRGNGTLNETFRHVAGNSRRFVACIYGMDIFLQDRERPELVTGKGDARFRQRCV